MDAVDPGRNLAVLLGTIRQETGEGELVLAQNDGVRRLGFIAGEVVQLTSDAAGDQFGSYLLRQGILDLASLSGLLAGEDRRPIGERVVQCGMLSLEERDAHLRGLQEQIMLHALEHPILHWTWTPAAMGRERGRDFKLGHREFIWRTFREWGSLGELTAILAAESTWQWESRQDLLASLGDLPLTSSTAYALSFLTAEPISFETFRFLSRLNEEDAGRLIATLWALGALVQSGGKLPSLGAIQAQSPALPSPPPQQGVQEDTGDLEELDSDAQLEFLDLDPEVDMGPPPGKPSGAEVPRDMPPCGPRPLPRPGPAPDEAPPSAPQSRFEADHPPEGIPLDPGRREIQPPPMPQGRQEAKLLLDRARRQVMLGRTVEAVFTLEESVRLQPDGDSAYEAWLMLGKLRMANHAWSARALQALRNAAQLRATAAEPWGIMAEIHHRMGSESEATACCRKALDLDPSVPLPPGLQPSRNPDPAFHGKPRKT